MKKIFFSTRTKLAAISVLIIVLLEAIALPLGFMMLTTSELNNEKQQKEMALDSLSTSFAEETVGPILDYDHIVFQSIYEEYKDVELLPDSKETEAYFNAYEDALENLPFFGMTQIGTFRSLILSSLKTTLIPSSSSYLYLAVYDPSTNIALVSVGASVDDNNVFDESVKRGYFFYYDYPIDDGFDTYNYYYESEHKGDIFVNVCEVKHKTQNDLDENSLRYLIISEVNVQTVAKTINDMTFKYFLIILITGLTLLAIFIFLTHFFFSKKVKALSFLSSKKKEGIIDGNFDKQFSLHKKRIYDEIDVLNDDLFYLEDELHKYVLQVEENIKISEKKKIEDDLSSKIQLSSLPSKNIHDTHISITPLIKPAKAVGGDLYDYFYIDDNHFAFFIGDVSGKGVPAALFMMKAKTLIKYALMSNNNILSAINYVNEQLLIDNEAFLFITAFFGIINIQDNTLHYVNAGHEKPLINNGNGYTYLEVAPNLPLGITKFNFVDGKIQLKADDTLFMYTDGVSEAKDCNDDLFGYERISNILNNHSKKPDFILNNIVLEEIEKFNHGHEQDDDICILSFKYKPSVITISNNVNELERVTAFINEKISFIENEEKISEIKVIVDEIASNIIHYAYKSKGEIDISIAFDDETVYLYFIDSGTPFNPFEYVEKRALTDIGGLGISLVKALSDSYDYNFIKKHNFVTITKKYK